MSKKICAEHAYRISMLFFLCWGNKIVEPMCIQLEKETGKVFWDKNHDCFFNNATEEGCYDWEYSDGITKLFGVSPSNQLEMEFTEDQVFELSKAYVFD